MTHNHLSKINIGSMREECHLLDNFLLLGNSPWFHFPYTTFLSLVLGKPICCFDLPFLSSQNFCRKANISKEINKNFVSFGISYYTDYKKFINFIKVFLQIP